MALPTKRRRRSTLLTGAVLAVALASVTSACGSGPSNPGPVRNDAATNNRPAQPKVAAQPLTVSSISPASGASGVATDAVLTVTYSAPLAGMPPTPTLDPAVVGNWTKQGNTLSFTPSGGWFPLASETVTIPPGATAMIGGAKATSTSPTTSTFTVAAGSETRVEQMLAELNYLPFNFVPSAPLPGQATSALTAEPTTAATVSTSPLAGTLNWSWTNVPPTLRPLWKPGQANTMDKGAIMAFENDHGMKMDGVAGSGVWQALLNAVANRQTDPNIYTYLVASETLPETLTVYRNGAVVYTTKANTGVSGATTAKGTFPVYLRFKSTEMKGTNPDGTKYDDPNIPWVAYFNGGDAVHGYPRSSYGWPQSVGCVELPISNAAVVWPMDTYGTLVTVTA
ncbi:MAG TPA: L,D-transpeptidase family protein [Pseudonocardiaceae bacterium]|nr:L,D-transpeptidase family protein [Pseudonocardiaceae bacterium]